MQRSKRVQITAAMVVRKPRMEQGLNSSSDERADSRSNSHGNGAPECDAQRRLNDIRAAGSSANGPESGQPKQAGDRNGPGQAAER
jgi:hypothetical protein